jgi:glycosyltransferase involved in cell wall biosynthesis
MRILHFVNENTLSWDKPFLQLLKYFNSTGMENVLLCPEGGTLSQRASDSGLEVENYTPVFSNIPVFCRDFLKIAGSVKPDLVHTRLSSAAAIASEWKGKLDCPVLATVDKYAKLKYYRKADHLVAVSTGVQDWFIQQGYPEQRICVIGNPLDVTFYDPLPKVRERIRSQEEMGSQNRVIFAAGRFVKWKGFDILLKACDLALKEEDFTLWLAGDGPERNNLEAIVRSSPLLDQRVKFWGYVEDVRPFMWSSDLFILPSREPEPFGLVLLEAMACALPVIATSAGGPLDMVTDKAGWLVPENDIISMKNVIIQALKDKHIRSKGSGAKKRASDYDVTAIGNSYIEQYQKLV